MAKHAVSHMNEHLLKSLIFISKSSTFSTAGCVFVWAEG